MVYLIANNLVITTYTVNVAINYTNIIDTCITHTW